MEHLDLESILAYSKTFIRFGLEGFETQSDSIHFMPQRPSNVHESDLMKQNSFLPAWMESIHDSALE